MAIIRNYTELNWQRQVNQRGPFIVRGLWAHKGGERYYGNVRAIVQGFTRTKTPADKRSLIATARGANLRKFWLTLTYEQQNDWSLQRYDTTHMTSRGYTATLSDVPYFVECNSRRLRSGRSIVLSPPGNYWPVYTPPIACSKSGSNIIVTWDGDGGEPYVCEIWISHEASAGRAATASLRRFVADVDAEVGIYTIVGVRPGYKTVWARWWVEEYGGALDYPYEADLDAQVWQRYQIGV